MTSAASSGLIGMNSRTTAGFLGGKYGQTGEPEAFAKKLREVLAAEE
jgi:hypothetical protein